MRDKNVYNSQESRRQLDAGTSLDVVFENVAYAIA